MGHLHTSGTFRKILADSQLKWNSGYVTSKLRVLRCDSKIGYLLTEAENLWLFCSREVSCLEDCGLAALLLQSLCYSVTGTSANLLLYHSCSAIQRSPIKGLAAHRDHGLPSAVLLQVVIHWDPSANSSLLLCQDMQLFLNNSFM